MSQLKSTASQQETFICFRNETSLSIDAFWINYKGKRIKYKTLLPSQTLDVITFVGHLWIFNAKDSGQRILANRKLIFKPKFYIHPLTHHMVRKLVSLTIPIYSLKECCFYTMKGKCSKSKKMQLPAPLMKEYEKFLVSTSLGP